MDRQRIAAHAFLAGIPEDEVDAVASVASERRYAAGEKLMAEGDFGHSMLLIEEGGAEVSVDGARVRSVGPGDVLGEVAILSSGRRTASVVATSPVTAICFFKRDVWALERSAPEAGRRLRAAIEEHVGSA
jgi:CRP/FNR family transcriptional regulator, cyclic AMP receptor protein